MRKYQKQYIHTIETKTNRLSLGVKESALLDLYRSDKIN